MTALSNADREVIVHALGLTRRGACGNHCRWSSRNFYYGRPDDPQLVSLVERGLMIAGRITTRHAMPNGQYFHVTFAGARAVGMERRVRREDRLKHERRPVARTASLVRLATLRTRGLKLTTAGWPSNAWPPAKSFSGGNALKLHAVWERYSAQRKKRIAKWRRATCVLKGKTRAADGPQMLLTRNRSNELHY